MTEESKKEKKIEKMTKDERSIAIWGIGFAIITILMVISDQQYATLGQMGTFAFAMIFMSWIMYHIRVIIQKRRANANPNP